MSDTLTVAPASETQQTAPVVVASPEPTRGTQQDSDRAALYEKHYGTSSGDPTPPATVTSTASAAQADPTLATTTVPPAGVSPEQFSQALQAIQAEFAALRTERTPTGTSTTEAVTEPGWISLLREGKVAEAEAALAQSIAGKLQGPTVEQAVARAREISRAEANIESFVKDLRTANPEISDLEPFIAMDAQQRLAVVQNEGKIKSTEDAVTYYKKAVLEATDSARKIAQKLRGSGKTEAMTRNREVLSASTLPPQGVDTARAQQTTDSEPVPETAESYFEKRKALEAQRKGLAQL